VLNEPPIGDPRLIDWLVEVAHLLNAKGYKAVLGNFAVGSYEPHHVEGGYFDRLLNVCTDDTNDHYLAIHEYTGILLPFNGMWETERLYDKAWAQPAHWQRDFPIARVKGKLPEYWHILRSSWLTLRAQETGLARPVRYWVTESGWDALSDLGNKGIYDHFKNKYGIPAPHTSIRGINTLAPIWRDYFPQWTFQQAAYEQLRWLDSIYPDNYVGFNLFTVSGAKDWNTAAGMDYSDLRELHTLLLTDEPADKPPALEFPADNDPAWQTQDLSPVSGEANIRAKPSTSSSIVYVLRLKTMIDVALDRAIADGQYKWYPVKVGDVRGYVRNDVVKRIVVTPPSEPERQTVTLSLTVSGSPDDIALLRRLLASVKVTVN